MSSSAEHDGRADGACSSIAAQRSTSVLIERPAGTLRVRLLGSVRAFAGESPLAIPPRTLPALAYLLLHRGEPIARDQMAAELWPDADAPRGRARLRSALHALARALPRERQWIVGDAESVRWNDAPPLWLDVCEFERGASDPATAAAAVAIYDGDFAPGFEHEWAVRERDRLHQHFVSALDALTVERRRLRRFDDAIVYARRLLATEPWREDVVRRLIAIRHESGDRSGALAEYEGFARRLREEFGAEPMPETHALLDAIVRDDPSFAPPALPDGDAGVNAPLRLLPFVGRARELSWLQARWTRAAGSSGGTVAIRGTAGAGKSALARELVRYVEDNGGRVLRGSAGFPASAPYQCFVEALRAAAPLVAAASIAPVWLAALRDLLPELRGRLDDELPPLDPQRQQPRFIEALVQTMLALSRSRPMLLVLEDLQWADEATIGALLALARRVPLASLLVVITFRDEEVTAAHPLRKFVRDLQSARLLDTLSPAPLELDDVAALLHAAAAIADGRAHDLAQRLLDRSDGNPLFLTHLVDVYIEEGRLRMPRKLRRLIAKRLEPLDDGARTVAEIAALAGQRFSCELLEEVCGWETRRVTRALDALIARRIIAEAGGGGTLEYDFTHQLVRAAITDAIAPDRARRRHRRIALALERIAGNRLHEAAPALAMHFEAAGDAPAAARWHLRAAQDAARIAARDVALHHLDRALALGESPAMRMGALLARETLHGLDGARAAQRADLAALEAIARITGSSTLRGEIAYRNFALARAVGAREEQAAHLAVLERNSAGVRRSALYFSQAQYLELLGRYDDAAAAARRAVRACGRANSEKRVEFLCTLARIEDRRGALDAGGRVLTRAARAAETPSAACRVIEQETRRALAMERWALLEERATELLSRCRTLGDRVGETAALTWLGIGLLGNGRYGAAIARLDDARRLATEIDDLPRLSVILANRALLDMTLGALDDAQRAFERALDIHRDQRDAAATFTCLNNLSAAHTYQGDSDRALALALSALAAARSLHSPAAATLALENLAEAQALAGDHATAAVTMEEALRQRRAIGTTIAIEWCHANLAIWYLRLGKLDLARENVRRALERDERHRSGPWPQYVFWAAAQVERCGGDEARARALLQRAAALVEEQASRCPSPEYRRAFLGLRWNRDIAQARDDGRWPSPPR